MRHLRKGRKLKRTASHRKALLSNLATSLFKSESKKIRTTVAKAKEVRTLVEHLITKAKRASTSEDKAVGVHAKREIYKVIKDRNIISSIFTDVVPKVKERAGGYTRVVKLGQRLGDAAEMAILELVDFNVAQDQEAASSKDKKAAKTEKTEKAEKTEKTEKAVKKTVKPAKKDAAPKTKKKKETTESAEEKPAKKTTRKKKTAEEK
jgi:large subunit ribosomal protein L17